MAEEQKPVLSKDAVTGFVAGVALAVAIVAIWLGFFGTDDIAGGIQAAASIVVAAGVVFAIAVYVIDRRRGTGRLARQRSENFKEAAIGEVERAWRIFTAANGADALPPADGLLWETTAAALIRYRSLRERVTEDDHRAIVSDAAERVHRQFSALLASYRDALTGTYYHSGTIDARAVAVIFDFATHPRVGATDLESVDLKALAASLPGAVATEYAATLKYLAGEAGYAGATSDAAMRPAGQRFAASSAARSANAG